MRQPALRGWLVTLRVIRAVVVLSVFVPSTAMAQSTGAGWFVPSDTPVKNVYLGFGAALTHSNSPDANQDGSVTGVTTASNDFGRRFFAGYLFNEHVSAEASHTDFGQTDFRGTSSGGESWFAGPVRATNDSSAWEFGVWGRWPIAPRWYAVGYLGWSRWKSTETFTEGTLVTIDEDEGTDVVFSGGLEFDIGLADRFLYRFDVGQRKIDDDRMTTATAQIIYRFP